MFPFRSESGLDPLVQVLEVLITSELNMNQAAPGNPLTPQVLWPLSARWRGARIFQKLPSSSKTTAMKS